MNRPVNRFGKLLTESMRSSPECTVRQMWLFSAVTPSISASETVDWESAAHRFVSYEDLKAGGHGHYRDLFVMGTSAEGIEK